MPPEVGNQTCAQHLFIQVSPSSALLRVVDILLISETFLQHTVPVLVQGGALR